MARGRRLVGDGSGGDGSGGQPPGDDDDQHATQRLDLRLIKKLSGKHGQSLPLIAQRRSSFTTTTV
jgi:hypothetical protein